MLAASVCKAGLERLELGWTPELGSALHLTARNLSCMPPVSVGTSGRGL